MAFHIIGDQDTVLGYRFAGVTGVVVENAKDALGAFNDALQNKDNAILLLTEQVEQMLEAKVIDHRLSATPPYIVVVNDIWGTKVERKTLEETIQEAVGIRITKEKK